MMPAANPIPSVINWQGWNLPEHHFPRRVRQVRAFTQAGCRYTASGWLTGIKVDIITGRIVPCHFFESKSGSGLARLWARHG